MKDTLSSLKQMFDDSFDVSTKLKIAEISLRYEIHIVKSILLNQLVGW